MRPLVGSLFSLYISGIREMGKATLAWVLLRVALILAFNNDLNNDIRATLPMSDKTTIIDENKRGESCKAGALATDKIGNGLGVDKESAPRAE